MPLSRAAKARLKREFALLQNDPPPGIRAKPNDGSRDVDDAAATPPSTASPAQWTHWTATIACPRESPFAGVELTVQIQFPPRYPIEPPACQFVGAIPFHPNIDDQGRICLDTLKRPPGGSWSPAVLLSSLLLSLQLLLGEPNAEDGLEPDATRLYQKSRDEWHKEAKRRILAAVHASLEQEAEPSIRKRDSSIALASPTKRLKMSTEES